MGKRAVPLILALVFGLWPAPASAAPRGSFNVDCVYSHTLPDDPIVAPGLPGGSHLHDFFGSTTTNATSTYDSMRASSTTCGLLEDTAGYWNPTAYLNGVQQSPIRVAAYYFGFANANVKSYPAGLQMLAGNKDATSGAVNPKVLWGCGKDGTPLRSHPYDCTPYGARVTARIDFPSCWTGRGLGPTTMTYPTNGKCSKTFPHRLPQLSYRVRWRIADPCVGAIPCTPDDAPDANIKLTLSSGAYYTMHADFWNTWNQAKLDQLVSTCLNAHVACGEQNTQA
ncbi:MAG TPA: DUF1996 domain-containing protein [Actinomycetota bacterium]|nr:DUF1996 domain-containing protein [Actinomycetota bacterium]